ncbi:PepSY domain-containing protein [Fusobacterium canifelinum]|uniref:PepSY domain-containing protein n=1 Tax=Fusobacterium canifelinum TaxID=285729 RepID=A0A3P1UN60_9FUSO|nr:PepSY domain-containing protein [Fusobacterium canifelinum]QQS87722.1 PepSY domain-containing protein [Fusobacterium canifelinum]RRD23171.1 peptidase [Fusobacterium canifelinum]
MKKLLILGAIILGSIGFSTSVLAAISEQQAKDIVKKEAPNGEITKFKLDKENGKMVYEIEVMDGNIEKEYEIDAETGAIVKMEKEQKGNKNANSVNNPKISYDKAKEIALKNSKNGKFKEIELKHKNGVLVYDVEIAEGFMDREFLIDANTGEILRDKKDF